VIGIYGGTFDPIHNGHLHVVHQLLNSGRFKVIHLVPAGDPQLRSAPNATGKDRLAMCTLAVAERKLSDRVKVSDTEINRSGPSYAIDTVREFAKQYPGDELVWIIGSDAYKRIDSWYESEKLRDEVSFLVIERSDANNDFDQELMSEMGAVDIDALEISATEVRRRLQNGESVGDLISSSVSRYIKESHLYGS
jgi:nicotinate-nucleotide adenylyltransferase